MSRASNYRDRGFRPDLPRSSLSPEALDGLARNQSAIGEDTGGELVSRDVIHHLQSRAAERRRGLRHGHPAVFERTLLVLARCGHFGTLSG
jgi:hypothetical protein